jgi:hypothetical protein
MFFVTARAPPTKLQAFATGWLNPGNRPLSRTVVDPGLALTPAIRTALAPNGLRTALHTIQNIFRRISDLTGFIPRVDAAYPVVHARQATPRTRSPDIFHVSVFFLRDPPSRGASAPVEIDRVFTARAFRRHTAATKDTSDRLLQSHISKMSTRTSRGYRLASRSYPRCAPVNDAVHAASFASASFSIVVPGFLVPDTPLGALKPLTPPSPPRFHTA